jgi:hypothetical protein
MADGLMLLHPEMKGKILTRISRIDANFFKARRAGIFVVNGIKKKSQAPLGAEYAALTGLDLFLDLDSTKMSRLRR